MRRIGRARATAVAAALAAIVLGAPAAAELPLWELGVGAAALRLPHYRGSDRSRAWLLPVPYAVYRGEWLRADRDGARARLIRTDRSRLELSLSAGPPTRSEDDPAREGMQDLAPTLEFGPTLEVDLRRGPGWALELRLPLRAVFTLERHPRAIGWTTTPNLNLDRRLGEWNLGLSGGPLWNSRRLDGYAYDVPAAAATPQRPAYRAGGGFAGWQGTLGLSRRFEQHWVGAFVRFDDVSGASFADSPLVRRERHLGFGVAWAWVPWRSGQRVHVPDATP
jgi:outer membrane scaffolding protein for murein synthesis (MipA/OmpV family)